MGLRSVFEAKSEPNFCFLPYKYFRLASVYSLAGPSLGSEGDEGILQRIKVVSPCLYYHHHQPAVTSIFF